MVGYTWRFSSSSLCGPALSQYWHTHIIIQSCTPGLVTHPWESGAVTNCVLLQVRMMPAWYVHWPQVGTVALGGRAHQETVSCLDILSGWKEDPWLASDQGGGEVLIHRLKLTGFLQFFNNKGELFTNLKI